MQVIHRQLTWNNFPNLPMNRYCVPITWNACKSHFSTVLQLQIRNTRRASVVLPLTKLHDAVLWGNSTTGSNFYFEWLYTNRYQVSIWLHKVHEMTLSNRVKFPCLNTWAFGASPSIDHCISIHLLNKNTVHHRVQNGSGAHTASYPMGTRSSFPGGKTAGVWSWPLTSI
jgi:hypothetical protein